MANIRKPRVSKEEQLKLINECRSSGMTDSDWCREHGAAVKVLVWSVYLGRFAAWLPRHTEEYAWIMLGKRYDIGDRKSYDEVCERFSLS